MQACNGFSPAAFFGERRFAEDLIDLNWADVSPEGNATKSNDLRGLIQYEDAPLVRRQPASSGIRTDWNRKTVRLQSYIVPIEYSEARAVAFI